EWSEYTRLTSASGLDIDFRALSQALSQLAPASFFRFYTQYPELRRKLRPMLPSIVESQMKALRGNLRRVGEGRTFMGDLAGAFGLKGEFFVTKEAYWMPETPDTQGLYILVMGIEAYSRVMKAAKISE